MKKMIHITAKQAVRYNIKLEIGKDITQAEADRLLKIDGDIEEINRDRTLSDDYGLLNDHLDPSCIYDSDGFEDVEVNEEEKEG